MIEWCSKKRMLIVLFLLAGLTVFILIIEGYLTSNDENFSSVNSTNFTNQNCWLNEKYEIINKCETCLDHEIAAKNYHVCKSGYKETIKCKNTGITYRSCEKSEWNEEKTFWIFHVCMIIASIVSSCAVYLRQKTLDRIAFIRVQNQA